MRHHTRRAQTLAGGGKPQSECQTFCSATGSLFVGLSVPGLLLTGESTTIAPDPHGFLRLSGSEFRAWVGDTLPVARHSSSEQSQQKTQAPAKHSRMLCNASVHGWDGCRSFSVSGPVQHFPLGIVFFVAGCLWIEMITSPYVRHSLRKQFWQRTVCCLGPCCVRPLPPLNKLSGHPVNADITSRCPRTRCLESAWVHRNFNGNSQHRWTKQS